MLRRIQHLAPLVGLPLALTGCGTPPGPGPTDAQVAARVVGREVGTIATHDEKELGFVAFRPVRMNSRRAGFIYFHGIESHSGWFDEAARQLAAKGYPVFSLDRRGSGINRENRGYVSGHVEKGTNLIDDIHRAVGLARKSGKVDEIYLIGLSWGGKYIMAYDATYPNEVDGMIQITPGMKPKVDLKPVQKLAVISDAVFAPKRQHRIPIEPTMFTTDPVNLDYIANDPLKLETVSASFLVQSVKMDKLVERLDDEKHPPLLVFLAGQDRIIDNEATRELVTRDPTRSVIVIEYEDQTHSIQLDAPGRLTRDIVKWVEALPRN